LRLNYPWRNDDAREAWRDWWEDKEISRGQTASETFLWSLMAAQLPQLGSLENDAALQKINVRFNRAINEALDAYCAQLKFQDDDSLMPT